MSEKEKLERLELLDRYYHGEMGPEESKAFEERLAREPELADALSLLIATAEGIRKQESEPLSPGEQAQLSRILQKSDAESRPPAQAEASAPPPKQRPPQAGGRQAFWPLIAAAASVLLIWLLWPAGNDQRAQQLALYQQEAFQRSSDLGSEPDSLLTAARLAFDRQDWQESIAGYEKLLARDSSNRMLMQDLASAYFWAGEKEKSLKTLQAIPSDDRQLKWAQAVLFLSHEDGEMQSRARPLLKDLAAGDSQKVLTSKAREALQLFF